MGTGALSLALNQIPVPIPGIHDLAGGIWLLDILLFVLFLTIYAARWILFFDEARQIARHSVLSMFFGAIPSLPSSTDLSCLEGEGSSCGLRKASGGLTRAWPSRAAF
jgi:tellurite resistance protein TehA-like permease